MDFALNEEQTAIFDMAHAFGQEHIAPYAREWEADGTIPRIFGRKVANWVSAGFTCPKMQAARA